MRTEAEIDIYEVIFRNELAGWPKEERMHCFLSIGRDAHRNPIPPPDEVMKRLAYLPLPVHSVTEASLVKITAPDGTVFIDAIRDPISSQRAFLQTVEILEWINDHEVRVRISSWSGPLAAGGHSIILRKTSTGWTADIRSITDEWIS